jgi:hypothetical protein
MQTPEQNNAVPEYESGLAKQVMLDLIAMRFYNPNGFRSLITNVWRTIPLRDRHRANGAMTPDDHRNAVAKEEYWTGFIVDSIVESAANYEHCLTTVTSSELRDL